MVEALPTNHLLRVVPPAELDARLEEEAVEQHRNSLVTVDDVPDFARYIRTRFEAFRNHRDNSTSGWNQRLLSAMRAFNGKYHDAKLMEIRKFGGSEVYARVIAMKCRGASSLLRDIYLSPERAWGIDPPEDPDIPDHIVQAIKELVQLEIQGLQQAGMPPPDPMQIQDRIMQLMAGAKKAELVQAKRRAEAAQDKVEEIFNDGGFYKAFSEFLVDLPLFPFACLKGPIVRILPNVRWENGQAISVQEPVLTWERVSPFDIYWTPGVANIEDAEIVERGRLTRADLNDALDLPGYNQENVRKVLELYGRGGLSDDWDTVDTERAEQENRENPRLNQSGLINCMEFHGNVQGKLLLEYGFTEEEIPDELRDYKVQAWIIGNYVIKAQLVASPRQRHPYYASSFEKVPGTPVGNGLPDILHDIQEVSNATLRALVNNMSISSGPQVDVNMDRLSPDENPDDMYPWKRWRTVSDPAGDKTRAAINFFQPQSNAAELLTVFKELNNMADDLSAIPKYLSGQGTGQGAGRTAAGLAMLMGNASKILQTVASNIDRDVFEPLLTALLDMIMLTDPSGVLNGDESVKILGVNVSIQRETQRARQLEFLQTTANPLDAGILGPRGRAAILRSVANTIGMDGERIVPSDDEVVEASAQQAQDRLREDGAKAQGGQSGGGVTDDMGPRENITGGAG